MFPNWVQVHYNTLTANAATTLRNPRNYSNEANAADVRPLIITQGSLVRFVGRWQLDVFTLSSPTVRVYGCNQNPYVSGAYPSGSIFWRLDAASFNAAGSTFTASVPATVQTDNDVYNYSEILSPNGMNLHGARSVLVVVETASIDFFEMFAQVLNI
jgi:hypothetical protein